jgi:hypothetical protein
LICYESGLVMMIVATWVAVSIVNFVAVEVGGRMFVACFDVITGMRRWAVIAVIRVVVVIDMAVKVAGAMKPRASADEGTAGEPFRAVVSVGSASVGGGLVVAVRAVGGDANVDAYLGLGRSSGCSEERKTSYCS